MQQLSPRQLSLLCICTKLIQSMLLASGGLHPNATAGQEHECLDICLPDRSEASDEQYSSTRYRTEYMRLSRAMKSQHAVAEFPQLQKLFSGTPQEKKQALKLFVQSGCNCEAVEASFSVTRETELGAEWEEAHLTVPEMVKEGFSQCLAC